MACGRARRRSLHNLLHVPAAIYEQDIRKEAAGTKG